jgi:replicative DNA helicase
MPDVLTDSERWYAERQVIGAMMLAPHLSCTKVYKWLEWHDFTDPRHQLLFSTIAVAWSDCLEQFGDFWWPDALIEKLEFYEELQAVGGREYLSDLIKSVKNVAHTKYFADQLIQNPNLG